MSKISLKHSGGNVVSLNSPTSAPTSADVAFKLPNADGTSGQVLKTDGSGNLSFAADSGGKFVSYAIIADQKSSGVQGGTFTTGAYRTRDLNTEIADADNIVSISSNQFTVQAGTYLIRAIAPGFNVSRHITVIYDVTGSAYGTEGTAAYSVNTMTYSSVYYRKTISSANVFEVRHRCQTTRASNGFGVESDISTNTYTVVQIFKEA